MRCVQGGYLGCWGGALVLLVVAPARAGEVPFRVVYDAPLECPAVAAFVAQVAARSAHGRLAGDLEVARTFRVTVLRARAGFRGEVAFRGGEAAPVLRDFAAVDCRELADALALVTALAIDAQAGAFADAPPTELPLTLPSWEAILPAPLPALADPAEAPAAPSAHPHSSVHHEAGLGGALDTGLAPGTTGAARLFWQARWDRHHLLRLDTAWATRDRVRLDGEAARFDVLVSTAGWCAWGGTRQVRWALPCLALEVGAIRTEGIRSDVVVEPQLEWTPWVAVDWLAHWSVGVGGRWRSGVDGGISLPLYRPVFRFDVPDSGEGFRTGVVGLRLGVTVGWAFGE